MDRITIKGLSFPGKHGYYPQERDTGNEFEVDVIAEGEFKQAIQENDLEKTFNYELAANCAENVISGPSELLIETLCYRIGEDLFEHAKSVKKLTVIVRKLHPPIETKAEYAEIEMTWNRP
ncbi:MAG TPA: dihydroneopterin aldolase [Balneolaceae bacterium]|nr:dihydroneopterin aldolase [Balneolaceae bacterium]